MSKLNVTDIQGFTLRGYNLPFARYLFLHFAEDPKHTRALLHELLGRITTGQCWDNGKPSSTLNIALSHRGLAALKLPAATLLTFPVEFQEGMKARSEILGDTGINAPKNWDEMWHSGHVHAWVAINGQTPADIDACHAELTDLIEKTGGARELGHQDAAAIVVDGGASTIEHFGYTDGFGNPDYVGVDRKSQPGHGKLAKDGKSWEPLATGELLLGYADEAGELPVAPMPHLLASNGTFMVYRKLKQNVAAFRAYIDHEAKFYTGGKAKLEAKFIGRWKDGTPLELSPNYENQAIVKDPDQSTNFTYSGDPEGTRCPMGAHLRRVNPRDSFGFKGGLVNRRRITRRGLPYGRYVPDGQPVSDTEDRGIVFMVLNASISRQFEFVQQQWIEYGNDNHLGNDKDPLLGNHGGHGKFAIQGDATAANPPMICSKLPNFVELKGGEYFFLPSITALGMLAMDLVDPR
ncbi:Dyp-type peroxidase family [Granulicella aggregans]|uniref:Dyp-type peroxidase family n=1 Tax=Granulicella aggregans TaxID=474949 RepID=A0A7W7ZD38_9BACT|nr:Dyp-type peroxidase [Granulicella aggregans]MBB5057116.1 Dyp-type peroxidase family [Granulicella aggregans]